MSNDEWRNIKRDVNRGIGFSLKWVLAIIALVVVISVAWWGIAVATSQIKGQGDAIQEKNSSDNFIEAQAEFENNFADIKATDLKIDNAYQALQASPDDKTLQTNYQGLKSYCLSVVSDYNADARSYLSEDFRAADLPQEINLNDSTTDCKENI